MALFAIADLHLSGNTEKPMDIFGELWLNHHEKIKMNWLKQVTNLDTVLLPGDISWAMKLEDALIDLKWINNLPGRKILVKGNHDYWWTSISKLNSIESELLFLQNNFYTYEDYAICGTRGWITPNSHKFTLQDEKIYLREANRLILSIANAKKAGYDKIIVMLHYPPTNESQEVSKFTEIMEEYGVEKVVYGHLHGDDSYEGGIQGVHNGVEYNLVSCDYLNFNLLRLL